MKLNGISVFVGDAHGVTIIIVESGLDYLSSIPEKGCLQFT